MNKICKTILTIPLLICLLFISIEWWYDPVGIKESSSMFDRVLITSIGVYCSLLLMLSIWLNDIRYLIRGY